MSRKQTVPIVRAGLTACEGHMTAGLSRPRGRGPFAVIVCLRAANGFQNYMAINSVGLECSLNL